MEQEIEQEQGTYEIEQKVENPVSNMEVGTETGMPPLIVVVQGGKNVSEW